MSRWVAAGIVVLGMAVMTALWMPAPASAQVGAEIPLKLFDRAEIDLTADCGVALWQASRDPVRDRFAVVFAETIGATGPAARIKIGSDVVSLTRIAVGGADSTRAMAPVQVYRTGIGDYVILDLATSPGPGGTLVITGGTLAVALRGRPVFRVSVAGRAGCAESTGRIASSTPLEGR